MTKFELPAGYCIKSAAAATVRVTGPGKFAGYGSLFDLTDATGEQTRRGSFSRSLGDYLRRKAWICANHNWATPVALCTSAVEDARGLRIEAEFLDTTAGVDAQKLVRAREKRGLPTPLSIGYRLIKHSYKGGVKILDDIDLHEISLVLVGACDGAETLVEPAAAQAAKAHELRRRLAEIKEQEEGRARAAKLRRMLLDSLIRHHLPATGRVSSEGRHGR